MRNFKKQAMVLATLSACMLSACNGGSDGEIPPTNQQQANGLNTLHTQGTTKSSYSKMIKQGQEICIELQKEKNLNPSRVIPEDIDITQKDEYFAPGKFAKYEKRNAYSVNRDTCEIVPDKPINKASIKSGRTSIKIDFTKGTGTTREEPDLTDIFKPLEQYALTDLAKSVDYKIIGTDTVAGQGCTMDSYSLPFPGTSCQWDAWPDKNSGQMGRYIILRQSGHYGDDSPFNFTYQVNQIEKNIRIPDDKFTVPSGIKLTTLD